MLWRIKQKTNFAEITTKSSDKQKNKRLWQDS